MENRVPNNNGMSNSQSESHNIDVYQSQYKRINSEGVRPQQSGFVSSTSWTTGDSRWYKNQINRTNSVGSRKIQHKDVSSSDGKISDVDVNQYLRRLFGGPD